MGRAINDGARGIAPNARPRARGGPATQATSVLARGPKSGGSRDQPQTGAPAGAVTPRRPRPGPPREQAPAPPSQAAAATGHRRARRSAGSRLLLGLLALLLIAAVIVAAVVLSSPTPTKVTLRNVVYSDVQQASSALKQLVLENTK
jgi:hypothetical protein